MTRDEFKGYMADAADANKAPAALAAISDGVAELFATSESAAAKIAEHEATISELRNVNTQMLLRSVGADGAEDEPKEETLDEFNARMGKLMRGEE